MTHSCPWKHEKSAGQVLGLLAPEEEKEWFISPLAATASTRLKLRVQRDGKKLGTYDPTELLNRPAMEPVLSVIFH